mmetsp:Transcript_5920/g.13014  ORF Transcript_5920/g.13014 Transcript_5920/m.13014 type:complete len:363 (+) Transcript_5920:193-1281(+)|eukprot:CAMPEP_0172553550 /NCGR_PEP_ID=MMETSP1067-20121228/51271_1 /TAXON_ID=265564 ORGANISM="Thalassiosira punctigera, Strain Tpunct2005C2" /NCGR_SAMPLE_ID=MMETSP1067 /ASSEMBLY_ACC=CAM_ASM_000444 /LENGTH=362 /DNA_ID=CAMNT_0013341759 /DNA_START=115 /DNA_END=1203 /DNA_ORIENTATION=-
MVETRSQRAAATNSGSHEVDDASQKSPDKNGKIAKQSSPSADGEHVQSHKDGGCPSHSKIEGEVDKIEAESKSSEIRSYIVIAILAAITYFTYPGNTWGNNGLKPTNHTVFYYGWISAISTGFGVLPLCFVREMKEYWVGVSNAIAAGMMIAASYSLFLEGCTFHDNDDDSSLSAPVRTAIGCLLGLLFILGTKTFLDRHEDVKLGSLSGADTRKILLIVFVMTLHSFSEGVGIGVSFGGEHGPGLGVFISASLAVHNVPEGLAVAIVLLPRKVSKATAAVWCVVTSLPQPLMAVPAFMFVHAFLPLLPVGLGFAGGAMMWVAFMELLLEAYEDTDLATTGVTSTIALAVMISIQQRIEDHA